MDRIRSLIATWRDQAAVLRKWNALPAADALSAVAVELEQALAQTEDVALTIREAALRTGRHPDTIEKAVRTGKLPNAGRKGRPRVRLGDLLAMYPILQVAEPKARTYDPAADARSLLAVRRGV